jgi:alkaline phosphatase
VALLPPRERGSDSHGPDLAVSARRAFELLADDPDGLVLIIECESTDEMGHGNDIEGLIAGVRELDRAVAEILKLTADRDDTLVLVTADHDTGSASLMYGTPYDDGRAMVRWTGHVHTAQWVPLFAFGPGSERFGRVMDNTEIGLEIARLLDLGGFPEIMEPGQGYSDPTVSGST